MHSSLSDIPFETALYRGLGRAVLFLEENDAQLYRKPILKAVLYNKVYDSQINGDRADYLFDVIHATGEPEYYARHIRQAIRTGSNKGYDEDNIYQIAYHLAKNGDLATRKAMYDGFPDRLDDGSGVGIRSLIQLDGIAAYAFIAERLMASEPDDEALREKYHYFPLIPLCEQYGEEGLSTAIEMARQANPHLTDYLNRLLVVRGNWKSKNDERKHSYRTQHTYEEVKARIDGVEGAPYVGPIGFARLDDAIRKRIAGELLVETESDRLIRYLKMFTHSSFPLDHTPLFALTCHENVKVAHLAYQVLENTTHPTVRSHALELLKERPVEKARYIIWLLTNNPGEGDLGRITSLTAGVNDEEELHGLYLAARNYLEVNPTGEAIPFLLKMYRETPCPTCRGGIVDQLEELNALPDWLCEEGIYDAESGIREVAGKTKSTQN